MEIYIYSNVIDCTVIGSKFGLLSVLSFLYSLCVSISFSKHVGVFVFLVLRCPFQCAFCLFWIDSGTIMTLTIVKLYKDKLMNEQPPFLH